jgi:DNA-binding response OmpR family regulator
MSQPRPDPAALEHELLIHRSRQAAMDPYSKSILVIHDDSELVRQLTDTLSVHGCRVEQIASARAAFDTLLQAPLRPRMIVLDWALAESERFPFLQHKAAQLRLASIPVIVMADLLQIRTLPSLGVRAVLATPLRPHMIADVVSALCGFTSPIATASSMSNSHAASVTDGAEARQGPRSGAVLDTSGGRLRLTRPRNTDDD